MADVFSGNADDFNRDWVNAAPHHYNRPLLPFLAGQLAHRILRDNYRAGFSIINLLAASLVALLLFRVLSKQESRWTLVWMPSVLFLSGFPQLNWGYHLLTDTLGLATALASACYASWLVQMTGDQPPDEATGGFVHLVPLFVVSSFAFLSRETAWLAIITAGWLVLARRETWKRHWARYGLILLALILGALPQRVYAHAWETSGVPFRTAFSSLIDVRYALDFVVKTGICFNIAWIPAVMLLWTCRADRLPPLTVGWTIGGILYMGAGYLGNSQEGIGYPLRMSYVLFLPVFFAVAELFERRIPSARRSVAAIAFCGLQLGTSLLGVFLDPGKSHFRTTDLLKAVRGFLGV